MVSKYAISIPSINIIFIKLLVIGKVPRITDMGENEKVLVLHKNRLSNKRNAMKFTVKKYQSEEQLISIIFLIEFLCVQE